MLERLKHLLTLILRTASVTPVAGDVLSYQGSNQVEWLDPAGLGALPDHTHQGVAGDGGQIDHGLAHTGLADDDHVRYLDGRAYMCRVFHNAAQNVNNNVVTPLAFNSELFDDSGIHDVAVNNSRITPGVIGTYLVGANIMYATDVTATGNRDILIENNGGGTYCAHTRIQAVTNGDFLNCETIWRTTNVADYFEVCAYQVSGGALNINYLPSRSPYFWCAEYE